jgi:hypothetical protein
MKESVPLYDVFVRTWWKDNPAFPNGLEPCAGHKAYKARRLNLAAARAWCNEYNTTHNPGRLSRKAEYVKVQTPVAA